MGKRMKEKRKWKCRERESEKKRKRKTLIGKREGNFFLEKEIEDHHLVTFQNMPTFLCFSSLIRRSFFEIQRPAAFSAMSLVRESGRGKQGGQL